MDKKNKDSLNVGIAVMEMTFHSRIRSINLSIGQGEDIQDKFGKT